MTAQRDDRVALALGAGGARGLAQIGVIEAIQARGLRIDAIAGSSSGALVGGVFAAGRLAEFRAGIEALDRGAFLRLLSDPALGEGGLFHGHRLVAAMREVVGNPDIETLPIPFIAVAVDLMRQRVVWLRKGPLWQALRASFAIPGLFTPAVVHGRELVDGGLLAPLPITATRLSDAQRLIAVDMHGWPERPQGRLPDERPDDDNHDGHRLAGWIERRVRRHWPERGEHAIGLTEVMARALDTMQAQIARAQLALDPPERVIRIPRDACLFYEFWRAREVIEIGRVEAEKALDAAGY
jgi:NTE family protein